MKKKSEADFLSFCSCFPCFPVNQAAPGSICNGPAAQEHRQYHPVAQVSIDNRPVAQGWEDSLEKDVATHCSVLAWRIPCTEEPGGYSLWVAKNRTQLSDRAQHRLPRCLWITIQLPECPRNKTLGEVSGRVDNGAGLRVASQGKAQPALQDPPAEAGGGRLTAGRGREAPRPSWKMRGQFGLPISWTSPRRPRPRRGELRGGDSWGAERRGRQPGGELVGGAGRGTAGGSGRGGQLSGRKRGKLGETAEGASGVGQPGGSTEGAAWGESGGGSQLGGRGGGHHGGRGGTAGGRAGVLQLGSRGGDTWGSPTMGRWRRSFVGPGQG